MKRVITTAAIIGFATVAAQAAHTYLVGALGDGGWISGDTRGAATLTFVTGPGAPTMGPGSLRLQTTSDTADKATLENRGSFGPLSPFAATYEWYRTAGQPAVAPALKLGIDTPDPNPTSTTAIARGEDRFDKILVYEPYLNPLGRVLSNGVWTMETISQGQGKWWIVDLDGAPTPGYGIGGPYQTLADWLADVNYGATLGAGDIVSLQLGVGTFNPGFDGNVDYLTYTLADGTHTADFGAIPDSDGDGVPDPTDACPGSDLTPMVVIDGCNTGVSNLLFENGCTIADEIAGIAAGAANHGGFVSGVGALKDALQQDGLLSGKQGGALQRCAAKADLP